MKNIILISFMLVTNAALATVTSFEKKEACRQVAKIVPTESGTGISLKVCLTTFQFDEVSETPALKVIEMIGQTVEDMATVCLVTLKTDPRFAVQPASPACELQ